MTKVKYSRDLRKVVNYIRRKGISLSIRATSKRNHPLFFGLYDATSRPLSKRIDILYRRSKFSSVHTLITIAHEYGHLHLGDKAVLDLSARDITKVLMNCHNSVSERGRQILWKEEHDAWQFAKGFLISQGFKHWDKYNELRLYGLSTYLIAFWGHEKKLKKVTKELISRKFPI